MNFLAIQRLAMVVLLCTASARSAHADLDKTLITTGKRATTLVEIRMEKEKSIVWGSAFCIDSAGIFVTNHHVASAAAKDNKITLFLNPGTTSQRALTAKLVRSDPKVDLAILKVDNPGTLDVLDLADNLTMTTLAETAPLTTFGYPFGGLLGMGKNGRPEISISMSRITSLRHDGGELQLIQMDGAINHGNSGGPVVNEYGKVVGIIMAIIPGAQVNFAIPANRVRRLLAQAGVNLTPKELTDPAALVLAAPVVEIEAAGRTAIPDEEAFKQAGKLVRELFAKQYADLTPLGRRNLARALLTSAAAETGDIAGRYTLLREAIEAAISMPDLPLALQAIEDIGRHFDIPTVEEKARLIARIGPKLTQPQDAGLVAAYGIQTLRALAGRDSIVDARKLIPIVREAANSSRNPTVIAKVREQLVSLEVQFTETEKAKVSIDKLAAAPDDPEANLAAGRYYCFIRGDFAKGLVLLAKGSDTSLKPLAARDLATGPTEAATGLKELGDAWWEQATKEAKNLPARNQCRLRCAYWYKQAEPQVQGLVKTLVQQRLEEIAPAATLPVQPLRFELPATQVVEQQMRAGHYNVTAEGKWSNGSRGAGGQLFGPEGFDAKKTGCLTALTADGKITLLGASAQLVVPTDGVIRFMIRDSLKSLKDNRGSVTVTITPTK